MIEDDSAVAPSFHFSFRLQVQYSLTLAVLQKSEGCLALTDAGQRQGSKAEPPTQTSFLSIPPPHLGSMNGGRARGGLGVPGVLGGRRAALRPPGVGGGQCTGAPGGTCCAMSCVGQNQNFKTSCFLQASWAQ